MAIHVGPRTRRIFPHPKRQDLTRQVVVMSKATTRFQHTKDAKHDDEIFRMMNVFSMKEWSFVFRCVGVSVEEPIVSILHNGVEIHQMPLIEGVTILESKSLNILFSTGDVVSIVVVSGTASIIDVALGGLDK
jgi:hypothetical protein